jgi:hypothetical protein
MIKKIIEKVGGIENFIITGICIIILILTIVWFRLDHLMNVFENMCFYDFDINSRCSCFSAKTAKNLSFLTENLAK